MKKILGIVLVLLLATFLVVGVSVAKYPTHQVTIVCPFGVGGASDTFLRALQKPLSKVLGVPVVIVNVAGAGGLKGMIYAARQPADGYTVLEFTPSHVIHSILKRSTYDLFKDFVILGRGEGDLYALVVSPKSKFKTFSQLLSWAEKHPYMLTMGGVSPMGLDDFAVHVFARKFGIKVTFVPFNKGSTAFAALAGGHIRAMLYKLRSLGPKVAAGMVKPLLVMSKKRIPAWKDVPAVTEFGVEYNIGSFRGFAVRKGSPKEAISLLEVSIKEAVNSSEYKAFSEKFIYIPGQGYLPPDKFVKEIEQVRVMFTKVAKELGYLK